MSAIDDGASCGHDERRGCSRAGCAITLCVAVVVVLIAIPNVSHARKSSGEAAPVGALKTIQTSQAVFRELDKERDGNLDYGMLSELSNVVLIDAVLGTGTKEGYFFSGTYSYRTSEFLGSRWQTRGPDGEW